MKTKKKPKVVVTEIELVSIRTQRMMLEELARSIKKAALDLAASEFKVLSKLKQGAPIEGQLNAVITLEKGRFAPPYKDELMDHMAKHHGVHSAEVEKALRDKYPVKEREVLVIDEKDLKVI
jgi:hypothetical protein